MPRYAIDAGDGIEVHACIDGDLTPETRDALAAVGRAAAAELRDSCMSCGGNDGYGPPPHHAPDCYFASAEDAAFPRNQLSEEENT